MWPKSDWVFSPRLLIRLYSELLSSVNDFTLVTSNLAMFSLFCLLIWPYNEENSFKMYCTCFQFGYHFYNKTTLIFLNAKRKKLLGIIFFFFVCIWKILPTGALKTLYFHFHNFIKKSENLNRPACASKRDVLELATLRCMLLLVYEKTSAKVYLTHFL